MNSSNGAMRSALYVPVPEAEAAVGHLRRRHDPTALAGIPAHISVVVPFLRPEQLMAGAYDALASIARSVSAFAYDLTRVGTWPAVLWLAPDPDDPFRELVERVVARWPDTEPYGGQHDEVVPHLTVGNGLEDEQLRRLRPVVEDALPIPAYARALHLKVLSEGRWRGVARFPLASSAR